MTTVDLNADLGEGFGIYRCCDNAAMLLLVSSANVACGLHAGDPEIMAQTFALARDRGVAVRAHPVYADLAGFGRRQIQLTSPEIERLVAYQIGTAQALAAYAGYRITHVKAHGALGNLAARERAVAEAIARAVKVVDPDLALIAIALIKQVRAGEDAGLLVVREIFADRGYDEAGQLIPRGRPDALIKEVETAAERVRIMVAEGAVVTAGGARLRTPIVSICVQGDSAHAVGTARAVRQALELTGIEIRAFAA